MAEKFEYDKAKRGLELLLGELQRLYNIEAAYEQLKISNSELTRKYEELKQEFSASSF